MIALFMMQLQEAVYSSTLSAVDTAVATAARGN